MIELEIECTPATASLDIKRVDRVIDALGNRDKLMSDVRKHLGIKAPPANRVKLPSISDRFNHTRNLAKSAEKFFTTGHNVPRACVRDVTCEPNPFSRAMETDILHKVFLRTENRNPNPDSCFVQRYCANPCVCLHKGATGPKKCGFLMPGRRSHLDSAVYSSPTVQPAQSCSAVNPILARLTVPDSPLPPSKMEVDPDFFETVKGRPVKERFNRHDFSRIQKQVFFKKLFSGFFEDEVKRRQEHYRLDIWELENISQELDEVKKTLEAFENESHSESVKMVTEQMTISRIREEKEDELRKCKGFVNAIKSSLYKKDDILSTSMYCRDILLEMSPPKFRSDYEIEVKKHRSKSKALVDKVVNLFIDFCRYNPDTEPDMFLNDVVTTFVKQLLSLGPPKIYFQNKWQLDLVFRRRSLQCMEQMADLEKMRSIQDEIDNVTKEVKKYYVAQIDIVRQEIDAFKANSEYQTNRSMELENEANNTLLTSFKEVVSGDVVLETLALVEVLYNYILGPSNAKFDAAEMMLQIEEELRNVDIQIQEIGEAGYRIYEKKVERKMKREMKEALQAKEKNRVTRAAILRAKNLYTKPPYGAGWRRTVQRSAPPSIRKKLAKADASVEKKHRHLQLEGICDRDDVEGEIDELLLKFIDHGGSQAQEDQLDSDDSAAKHTSLRSSISTASLEKAIAPVIDDLEIAESSVKSLSLVQLDYDSEEELMRKNFERRKAHGEDIREEDYGALYDVRSIDSRFMVTGEHRTGSPVKAAKDTKNRHRPSKRSAINPLSWR